MINIIEAFFTYLAIPIFYMILFYQYSIKTLKSDPDTKINISSLYFMNSLRNIDVIKLLRAYAKRNKNQTIEIGIKIYKISLVIVLVLFGVIIFLVAKEVLNTL